MFLQDLMIYMTVGENDTVDSLELNDDTIGVTTGHVNFKGILGKRFADLGGASIIVTLLLARFQIFFNKFSFFYSLFLLDIPLKLKKIILGLPMCFNVTLVNPQSPCPRF